MNESEAIENCGKSVGILSNETIVAQHPWTTDVELELERIKKERKKQWNRRRITTALLGMFRKKILMVMKAGTNNPRLPYMPGQ